MPYLTPPKCRANLIQFFFRKKITRDHWSENEKWTEIIDKICLKYRDRTKFVWSFGGQGHVTERPCNDKSNEGSARGLLCAK